MDGRQPLSYKFAIIQKKSDTQPDFEKKIFVCHKHEFSGIES